MSTVGYFHLTAQYFTDPSPVILPSRQLCFIFADVHLLQVISTDVSQA